ncbi:hypothetical protein GCM10008932_12370 [Alkalibacterium iburiense]|uniref:Uncharacterized protein n=1 Tax=Alkalibacterium iburiense TaxID=290589 RepID=A0ABN0XDH8_9LACT
MKVNDKLDTSKVTFKETMLIIMLLVVGIPFFNGIFSSDGFNVQFLVSSIIGSGIATLLTYYFLNNKSFKSVNLSKFALIMVINIVISTSIAMASVFVFFMCSLFLNTVLEFEMQNNSSVIIRKVGHKECDLMLLFIFSTLSSSF